MTARDVLSWILYPSLLIAAVGGTWVALRAGAPPTATVLIASLLASIPLLLAQRVLPYHEGWRGRPKDFQIDLLHTASTGLSSEVWRATTSALFFGVGAWIAATVGGSLWPSQWPVLLQLALALLLGDLGAYWVHRSCHRVPLLWRIHAMHHSSERLYVLSSGRNHPANVILTYGSQVVPVALLGAPDLVIALMSVFTAVHGLLQHSNVEMRHGWLNRVFATADLHRWHHSTHFDESNTNFGSNLILWDWVFGTRYLPEERRCTEVGLDDLALPENFLHHLISPFVLYKYAVRTVTDPFIKKPETSRAG